MLQRYKNITHINNVNYLFFVNKLNSINNVNLVLKYTISKIIYPNPKNKPHTIICANLIFEVTMSRKWGIIWRFCAGVVLENRFSEPTPPWLFSLTNWQNCMIRAKNSDSNKSGKANIAYNYIINCFASIRYNDNYIIKCTIHNTNYKTTIRVNKVNTV